MSLIDWSDPEEMLGLLVEYVADEASAADGDPDRAALLRDLRRELETVAARPFGAVHQLEAALSEIRDAQPRELAHDSVMTHVDACIEELKRIESQSLRGSESQSLRVAKSESQNSRGRVAASSATLSL